MRRRSTIAPVREDEVLSSAPALKPSRHSFVPRQLTFDKNKTAGLKQVKGTGSVRGSTSKRLSRIGISNESVYDASILAQTISEDDSTVVHPKAVFSNLPPTAACSRANQVPSNFSSTSSFSPKSKESHITLEENSTITNKTALCPGTSQSASSGAKAVNRLRSMDKTKPSTIEAKTQNSVTKFNTSESKIPKPKIFSASKPLTPESQFNSTAAFEEVEIAALTSTPHPERSVRRPLLMSSSNDEVQLFLSEQRSVMQAIKLTFQKMNSVLDSQLQVNLETVGLLKEIRKGQCNFQFNSMLNPTSKSTENADFGVSCSEKISLCPNNLEFEKLSFKKLSPCKEDDKENVALSFKPDSLYRDMKSQLGCLKTPTVLRRAKPMSVETPNTYLSNTLHHQLESLFEDNVIQE